jgi:hypothetical protein
MFCFFRGFLILSDADGDVTFGDEINVSLSVIVDDKLPFVKSTHLWKSATELIIH